MSDFNTKVELFIGLTSQHGVAFYPEWAIQEVVSPLLAEFGFDGFSVSVNAGYWKGVSEQSLTITVFCNDYKWVRQAAEEIATRLNQETVLVNVSWANATLIG